MIKDGRAVLFIHIPKTAGTAIERSFERAGWTVHYRENRRTHAETFDLLRCPPQHFQASLLTEVFALGKFDLIFATVREPIARFRSEFMMRNRKLEEPPTSEMVDAWAERVFRRYEVNPYMFDNHLRPQHEFVLPGAEVYRLEDGLDTVTADLNARFDFGLDGKLRGLRSGNVTNFPSSAVPVSPELTDYLRTRYAADFREFGYGN
jgi:hypothetical protein